MSQRRPIYLDLTRIHMPVTAIVSILHRVSGVLLFLALPLFAAGFQRLLASQQSFDALVHWLEQPSAKLLLATSILLFILHLAAGARHLLLDVGLGIHRPAARNAAWAVLIFSFAVVLTGVLSLW